MSVGIKTGDNDILSGTTSGVVGVPKQGQLGKSNGVNVPMYSLGGVPSLTAIALFEEGARWFMKQSTRLYDSELGIPRTLHQI